MSETGARRRDPHQLRQMAHCMKAQLALGDDSRYYWLCDRSVIEAGKPKRWQPQLLAGLGRLLEERGREVMLELADQLCQDQPAPRQALLHIRQRRMEGGPRRSLALAAVLIDAAEHFFSGDTPLSSEEIMAALDEVRATLLADF